MTAPKRFDHEPGRSWRPAGGRGSGGRVDQAELSRRRAGDGRSWLFLLNHTAEPATVPADGVDLLTGAETAGSVALPSGGVAVVREREADFS
jgi:beta-galactosidase